MSRPAAPPAVRTEEFRVASDTAGIELAVRRKRPDGARSSPDRTVVLVHGATFPSGSLYDAPVPGGSFLDRLASRGFDAYAVDLRGFGGSDRPPEMERDPEGAAPVAPFATALRDLDSAVAAVLERTASGRVSLIGTSWGGSIAGAYAAARPDRVERLALVAPLWLLDEPALIDPGGELGSYRRIDVRAFREVWLAAVPPDRRDGLIPPGVFEAWVEATLRTDGRSGRPGTIRAPSGPVQDIRDRWRAGRPAYEPARIECPVLLVAAEWDRIVPFETVRSLFDRLTGAPSRRLVLIGEGTHMILLERNRDEVIDALAGFLAAAERIAGG